MTANVQMFLQKVFIHRMHLFGLEVDVGPFDLYLFTRIFWVFPRLSREIQPQVFHFCFYSPY